MMLYSLMNFESESGSSYSNPSRPNHSWFDRTTTHISSISWSPDDTWNPMEQYCIMFRTNLSHTKAQACQAHLQQDGWSENGGAIERQVIQTPGARSARQRLEYSTIKGTGVWVVLWSKFLGVLGLEWCQEHHKGRHSALQGLAGLKTKCKEGRVQDCQVENVTYPFVTGQGEFKHSVLECPGLVQRAVGIEVAVPIPMELLAERAPAEALPPDMGQLDLPFERKKPEQHVCPLQNFHGNLQQKKLQIVDKYRQRQGQAQNVQKEQCHRPWCQKPHLPRAWGKIFDMRYVYAMC